MFYFFFQETCLFLTFCFQKPKTKGFFLIIKNSKIEGYDKSNNHPTLLVKSNGGQALGCLLFDLLQPLNVNETPFFYYEY